MQYNKYTNPWTENDIKNLRSYYPSVTWIELHALFPNRSRQSIISQASLLKIRRQLKFKLSESKCCILTETQRAYVAGMVDGEGCIGMSWSKKRGLGTARITITNTNKEVIDYLRCIIGCGNVFVSKRKKDYHKIAYHYQIDRQMDVYVLLKQVGNFLIVKRAQAAIALQYIEGKRTNSHKEYIKNDETFIRGRLSMLNKRGI